MQPPLFQSTLIKPIQGKLGFNHTASATALNVALINVSSNMGLYRMFSDIDKYRGNNGATRLSVFNYFGILF